MPGAATFLNVTVAVSVQATPNTSQVSWAYMLEQCASFHRNASTLQRMLASSGHNFSDFTVVNVSAVHVDERPCDSDLSVRGAFTPTSSAEVEGAGGADSSAASNTSTASGDAALELQLPSHARLVFDACLSGPGAFNAYVSLRTRRLSGSSASHVDVVAAPDVAGGANDSNSTSRHVTAAPSPAPEAAPPYVANITVSFLLVDTRPYRISCLPFSTRRSGHTLTRVGQYLVMFGGLAVLTDSEAAVPVNDLWAIREKGDDASAFEWESMDRTHDIFIRPRARYGHVAAGTSDGLFAIYGGYNDGEYLSDVWIIQLGDSAVSAGDGSLVPFRWQKCYGSVHGPTASLMMAGVTFGHSHWFLFGGQERSGSLSNDIWHLDLADVSASSTPWKVVPMYQTRVPAGRLGHTMIWWPVRPDEAIRRAGVVRGVSGASDEGGLLAFGGATFGSTGVELQNDLWFYDISSNEWIPLEVTKVDPFDQSLGTPSRPPPLAFHSASRLGPAMIVAGGIAEQDAQYSVRSELWRWMDLQGWSLQFASDAIDGTSSFKYGSMGTMEYWPAIGRLLLYGGLGDTDAFVGWQQSVANASVARPGALYMPYVSYYPAALSGHVQADAIKGAVLVLEEAACTQTWDQETGALVDVADVCTPCGAGAVVRTVPNASDAGAADTSAEGAGVVAPWMHPGALQCVPCVAGMIYTTGQCQPCPAGFFGTSRGMDSWEMCRPCPAHTYGESSGASECTVCPGQNASASSELAQNSGRTGGRALGAGEDDSDGSGPAQTCPMFARSAGEALNSQRVHEENRPHGVDSQQEHLWWQALGTTVWASVVTTGLFMIVLVQTRQPRRVQVFMRQFDLRPITAAPVPTEAGGVIFFIYIVTCTCFSFVGCVHHVLSNTQLTAMTVPAEENVRRAGHIAVDMEVVVELAGYTGPCTASDFLDSDEGPSVPAPSRRMSGARLQTPGSSAWRDAALASLKGFANAASDGHVSVAEDFAAQGAAGWRVTRWGTHHHATSAPHVAAEAAPSRKHGRWPFGVPPDFAVSGRLRDLLLPDVALHWRDWLPGAAGTGTSGPGTRAGDEAAGRRHLDAEEPCHPLVSLSAEGIVTARKEVSRCKRVDDRTCRISQSCHGCSIGKEVAWYRITVKEGYVFTAAREVRWRVHAAWREEAEQKARLEAYTSVDSIVTSGDLSRCLRGLKPSTISLAMVPTDYQDRINPSHLYGFVAQYIDANVGSTASPSDFHQQPAQLNAEVELHISHTFYKLVLSKKSTAFDFLAQILGFLSGMSLLARVICAAWNALPEGPRKMVSWVWTNPAIRVTSCILCFWVPIEDPDNERPPDSARAETPLLRPASFNGPAGADSGYQQVSTHVLDEAFDEGRAACVARLPLAQAPPLRVSEMELTPSDRSHIQFD